MEATVCVYVFQKNNPTFSEVQLRDDMFKGSNTPFKSAYQLLVLNTL